eukprot:gene3724-4073_t
MAGDFDHTRKSKLQNLQTPKLRMWTTVPEAGSSGSGAVLGVPLKDNLLLLTYDHDLMAPRILKTTAQLLFPNIKSVTVKGYFFEKRSTSAYEIYRQMQGKRLAKINPKFTSELIETEDDSQPPSFVAEFIDGTKLELDTSEMTAADIRYQLFMQAEEVEDNAEEDTLEFEEDDNGSNINEPDVSEKKAADKKAADKKGGDKKSAAADKKGGKK